MTEIVVYDTTLRDGAQQEGMNLSVADKVALLPILESMGADYIEGGWPGAIPKDTEFFDYLKTNNPLTKATLVAFGSTTKAGVPAETDGQVGALVNSGAGTICLVAKSDIRHVHNALRTTGEENLRMVADSVEYLRSQGRDVMIDCEHFFDGFAYDPEYTTSVVAQAFTSGASWVVLCDTNGGSLPNHVTDVVTELRSRLAALGITDPNLGIHTHDDTGCAVANTLAAVQAGCRQVQGTVNGSGERTGNANILTTIANLQLKLGYDVVTDEELAGLTSVAFAVAELANIAPQERQPYVGASAFAHKAGLHASAIRVDPDLYQHIDPALVGNDMRMVISDMAGRASIELKAREFGLELAGENDKLQAITQRVKEAEAAGYTFDAADASFELLARETAGGARIRYFDVESWSARVTSVPGSESDSTSEATVKLVAGGRRYAKLGEGVGPVDALDSALRAALRDVYPQLEDLSLVDFKVRIVDSMSATKAITRVLITMKDHEDTWITVGVGRDVIEASWEALTSGYVYGLFRAGVEPNL